MKKFAAVIMLIATAMLALPMQAQTPNKNNTLIVFFSHAGQNYEGNLAIGNTHVIANYIAAYTGADVFEIKPVDSAAYNLTHSQLTQFARNQQTANERPAFEGRIANLDKYDYVFIGSPIWWGTFPQIYQTFFDTYDLNGKTLIPFTTHAGSGLGQIPSVLRSRYPGATLLSGLATVGRNVGSAQGSVESWLRNLGFSQNTGVDDLAADLAPQTYTAYSIDGRLVLDHAASITALAPGLYVVNGKKLLVRP